MVGITGAFQLLVDLGQVVVGQRQAILRSLCLLEGPELLLQRDRCLQRFLCPLVLSLGKVSPAQVGEQRVAGDGLFLLVLLPLFWPSPCCLVQVEEASQEHGLGLIVFALGVVQVTQAPIGQGIVQVALDGLLVPGLRLVGAADAVIDVGQVVVRHFQVGGEGHRPLELGLASVKSPAHSAAKPWLL